VRLKRIYARPEGWVKEYNTKDEDGLLVDPGRPEGAILNVPPFDHIEVEHTGSAPEQNFSTRQVARGLSEGWISIGKGKLILHAKPEDLVYDILRAPGRYCLHCGEKLEDDIAGALARVHVATRHVGAKSPDPATPSGYVWLTFYECRLDAKQQKRFAAKPLGGPRG